MSCFEKLVCGLLDWITAVFCEDKDCVKLPLEYFFHTCK
jgi:hypothetical protein